MSSLKNNFIASATRCTSQPRRINPIDALFGPILSWIIAEPFLSSQTRTGTRDKHKMTTNKALAKIIPKSNIKYYLKTNSNITL